jgi:heme O synthase-like polyprenyltransferase
LLYTVILAPLGRSPWLPGYPGFLYGATRLSGDAIMLSLALHVYRERAPAGRASRRPWQ